MKKISLMAVVAAVLVTGCSSIPLDPHASRVVVSTNKPPKGCKYIGQVVGNQGNFFTGSWTSNRNLEEGAMNDIKNQTTKLGGNYVQLISTRAGNTGSHGGATEQTNVTNVGNAYVCVPSKIGL
jgi:hypothetical protein